jgi:biotin carboxyl carrier protein
MKMETMLRAEVDGIVAQVHVIPGAVVAAKDLLVSLAA